MKQQILVIRLSSLGDIVLTSPTLINLRIAYPGSHIVYLTKENFGAVPAMMPVVDEVVTVPSKCSTWRFLKIIHELDKREFDLIVDLHGSNRSWLARQFISASQKVVYPKNRLFRLAVTRKNKTLPEEYCHTIDLYNDCLKQLDQKAYCYRPVLEPESLKADNKPGRENRIVIAPGASFENKKWLPGRFSEVALALYKTLGVKIDWVVISKDRVKPDFKDGIPQDCFKEHVDLSIPELTDLISRARLTIANDSGIAHLSSAVNTPVISIFGSTHPVLGFKPRGFFDCIMEVDEPCRPCSRHGDKECYREKRYCFERVTSQAVIDKAVEISKAGTLKDKAVFIDRDGTLIVEKHYLFNPEKVEFEEGALEALKMLKAAGYKLVIVSNQSGVARGFYAISDVENVNRHILELLGREGIEIDAVYYCPYHVEGEVPEFAQNTPDRKPGPGMAEKAAEALGIDFRRSFVIGDSVTDLLLGTVIGAESFLVETGYGPKQAERLKSYNMKRPFKVVRNIKEAAKIIVKQSG